MRVVANGRSRSWCSKLLAPRLCLPCSVMAFLLIFGLSTIIFAFQESVLETAETIPELEQPPAAHEKSPSSDKENRPAPLPLPDTGAALPKTEPHAPEGLPPGAAERVAPHGEEHVQLPVISPVPGVAFLDTLIRLMDYELNVRFLGWRPNGILVCRLTNNINNYQLGVLEAVRFTTLRLKDSLTRLGEADSYDPDLEQALNLFMISATSWWLPSAASSYDQAIGHLKKFRTKLETGQRNFYYRRDTLVSLISTYKDQIGNVDRMLVMPVGWFKSDDYFYYAKGVAHVYYEILKVCRVGFKSQLATMHATDIMDEVLHELSIAESIDPWIVLDSDYNGFLANHRANLNAPLSEAAHLLVVLSLL